MQKSNFLNLGLSGGQINDVIKAHNSLTIKALCFTNHELRWWADHSDRAV
jgi:hypothetical protein